MIDKMNVELDLAWQIEQQSVEKHICSNWPWMNNLENYKVTLDLDILGHQLAIL